MRKMSDWFVYRVESESIRQIKNNFHFETRYSKNAKHSNSHIPVRQNLWVLLLVAIE